MRGVYRVVNLPRDRAINLKTWWDKHQFRAFADGRHRRHCRPNAELARLIARGRDNAALRAMSDRHRLTPEIWIVALLNGRIESVHINVNDFSNRRVAHDDELSRSRTFTRPQSIRRFLRSAIRLREEQRRSRRFPLEPCRRCLEGRHTSRRSPRARHESAPLASPKAVSSPCARVRGLLAYRKIFPRSLRCDGESAGRSDTDTRAPSWFAGLGQPAAPQRPISRIGATRARPEWRSAHR